MGLVEVLSVLAEYSSPAPTQGYPWKGATHRQLAVDALPSHAKS
jgi:hypothetical protein